MGLLRKFHIGSANSNRFFPGFPGVSWQEMSHFSCLLAGNSDTRKCATLNSVGNTHQNS